ncbi:MAG: energy-coupling factor transporter transmembrane component T [Conexivisphaerales archaeon]
MKLVFYIPGTTWLHNLYPLTKLTTFICVMVIAFAFQNPLPSYAMAAFSMIVAAMLGSKYFMSILRPLILIFPAICAMIFFQAFFPIVAAPRPFHFLNFTIYYNGLYYGLELAGRVLLAISWGILVFVVTHPGDLFTALRRIKVPYLAGFMVVTMLQFVPILMAESNTIMEAQQSRGLRLRGFRAILPNLVPLFVGAWERAQVLAMSMEVRGVGSSGVKTSFRKVRIRLVDKIILAGSIIATAIITWYSAIHGFFNGINTWVAPPVFAGSVALVALVGFFVTMGVAVASYRA